MARAGGEPPGGRRAVGIHEPETRLVAVVLRIHRHEHVGRLAAVGRDLGARHPAEREQIAVRDSALLCGERYHTATRYLGQRDRKSTRLNSSHLVISYAVFCLKKKKKKKGTQSTVSKHM